MNPDFIMGKPTQEETAAHYDWAKENGAVLEYLDKVADGYTGIAATLDTGIDGPVVVFRVDMDALPIYESEESSHFPLQEGFRSVNNEMHAAAMMFTRQSALVLQLS